MAVVQNQKPLPTTDVDGKPLQTIGTAAPTGQNTSTGAPAALNTQPQGSGRFTNIQKYINANKSGGQKIAGQIGNTLQSQFGEQSKQAQDYNSKLQQGIQQGNQVAQAGQGYTQQLKDIGGQIQGATLTPEQLADQNASQQALANRGQQNFGIEQFTQQPNFNQFQDIQAGRGINESLLALQQQRAAQAAGSALQGSQQAQQALGTEGGRYALLQKQFGGNTGPGYSQGQQRLDQVLLGQGGGLNSLQAQTSAQNRVNSELAKSAASGAGDVSRLTNQERGLIGDINNQATSNADAYTKMLESYVNPLNTQRAGEVSDLGAAISSYNKPYAVGGEGQRQSGFTDEQMTRLGLTGKNTGVYNVFKGQQGVGGVENVNQIASLGAQARNAQDVANQQDVDRYKALAKIIGNDYVPQINKASELGASYEAKTGDEGLKERLTAAQKAYDTAAANENYSYSPYGLVRMNTTTNDLLNKGLSGISATPLIGAPGKGSYGQALTLPDFLTSQYNRGTASSTAAAGKNYILDAYKNLLNEQNYNQTLGGRRETFLDTMAAAELAKKGIVPKFDATPITQVDPSLNQDVNKTPNTLLPGQVGKL